MDRPRRGDSGHIGETGAGAGGSSFKVNADGLRRPKQEAAGKEARRPLLHLEVIQQLDKTPTEA
jgi:hypothetical protein